MDTGKGGTNGYRSRKIKKPKIEKEKQESLQKKQHTTYGGCFTDGGHLNLTTWSPHGLHVDHEDVSALTENPFFGQPYSEFRSRL